MTAAFIITMKTFSISWYNDQFLSLAPLSSELEQGTGVEVSGQVVRGFASMGTSSPIPRKSVLFTVRRQWWSYFWVRFLVVTVCVLRMSLVQAPGQSISIHVFSKPRSTTWCYSLMENRLAGKLLKSCFCATLFLPDHRAFHKHREKCKKTLK